MSDEKKTKEDKKNDGSAAKLRGLEAKVNKVINRLEQLTGFDLDGDGQIGKGGNTRVAMLIVMVLCACAFGANEIIHSFKDSTGATSVWTVDAEGDVVANSFSGDGSGLSGFSVTIEDNVGTLILTNGVNGGECQLSSYVDASGDAGDFSALNFPDGGGMLFQTDVSAKGTLATKITIASDGGVTLNDTLAMTGIATFTAKDVHNGGIDVNEDVEIDFDATDEEFAIETSTGAAIVSRVYANVANPTTTVLLGLDYSANSDNDGSFIACRDNAAGDTVFSVGVDGDTAMGNNATIAGTLAVTGIATFTGQDVHTGGIDVNEDVDIDFDAADEEVSIVNTAEYAADGAQLTVNNTDADVGAAMYLARLRYTDDGQANADFLVCEDNDGDDMVAITDGGDITMAGILTSAEAITLTDADGAAVITATGYDDSDASLVLDADNGDDNADTWTITSQQSGNDLSIINHATEVMNLTSAGALQVDGSFTATGTIIASADIDSNELDAETATDLLIGKATATGIVLGATDAETTVAGALFVVPVVVTDATTYTVLAINSGHTHIVPDLTADCVLTMPSAAAGLHYKFVYAGGAEDAQDWDLDTGDDLEYYVGGLVHHDPDAGGDDTATTYSDGGSNSKLGIITPAAGTVVEMWCSDGTTWYVTGSVISTTDAAVTFADQ